MPCKVISCGETLECNILPIHDQTKAELIVYDHAFLPAPRFSMVGEGASVEVDSLSLGLFFAVMVAERVPAFMVIVIPYGP